jgi:predicted ATPase
VIEHIEIEGFKSLEKVSLDLGPLNIFVGTNASGKTNFLEALRVLQGIGYGYTVDEIFNGKPRGANSEVWDGIRGGSRFASFLKASGERDSIYFRIVAPNVVGAVDYRVHISPEDGTLTGIASAGGSGYALPSLPWTSEFQMVDPTIEDPAWIEAVASVRGQLRDVQFFSPSPRILRDYSAAAAAHRMGDHGEDFAGVIDSILRNAQKGSDYVSWLKELTPNELDEVKILVGARNDRLFAVTKNGVDYPADILSDGTLRFAAIAAAFFQPVPPRLLLLEEIEEGLHPTRLQLLVELLKSQSGRGIEQVIATSHSPYAIAWLKEEDYRYVFLCTKDEETGATTITPFSEVPHLIEVARRHPISDLIVQGWLENAV